jgi:hypothetical protein
LAIRDHESSPTSTGHIVGRTYLSRESGQLYVVQGVATLWELEPGGAVAVRWENGNTTVRDRPRGSDPEVCRRCATHIESVAPHGCTARESRRAAVA